MAKKQKKGNTSHLLPKTLPNLQRTSVPKRLAVQELRLHAFVNEYKLTFNSTASARKAGYAESAAKAEGCRLLADARVQDLLSKHVLDVTAETNIRTGDILKAASEIAYLDPGACFDQSIDPKTQVVTLRLRDLTEMPAHIRRTISAFKVIKRNLTAGDGFVDTIIEVKFWNKVEALKLLALYKNLLNTKADDSMVNRQIEKMSDTELAVAYREGLEKWDRHVAARSKARLALVPKEA